MSKIIYPDYMRIVERKPRGWLIRTGRTFYRPTMQPALDRNDYGFVYGISDEQIAIELFRVNGGALGYYLADLRHKRFYYCGLEWADIKTKLLELGIGRIDPLT